MKGLIFTEFLDFVEQKTSYEMVDKILLEANIEHEGAYTSLGTYDAHEMIRLVKIFSEKTKRTTKEILIEFGQFLFKKFLSHFPSLFKEKSSTFHFLYSVENYIHMEVNKLHKDAELPHFECTVVTPTEFVMIYTSSRPLADLAEGLIKGCVEYHQEEISIIREDMAVPKGFKTKFTLIKKSRLNA